jgi:hypothetical protein
MIDWATQVDKITDELRIRLAAIQPSEKYLFDDIPRYPFG